MPFFRIELNDIEKIIYSNIKQLTTIDLNYLAHTANRIAEDAIANMKTDTEIEISWVVGFMRDIPSHHLRNLAWEKIKLLELDGGNLCFLLNAACYQRDYNLAKNLSEKVLSLSEETKRSFLQEVYRLKHSMSVPMEISEVAEKVDEWLKNPAPTPSITEL